MSRIPNQKKTFRDNAHANFMAGPSYCISDPIDCLRIAASSCFFGEPMYYHRDLNDVRPYEHNNSLLDVDVAYLAEQLNEISPVEWRTKTPAELLESAIDAALDYDAEKTLQFAVTLRNDEYIRTTPQVILVRAAHNLTVRGTGLVRKYGRKIIVRADEPSVCIAYHKWRFDKKPIPNSLKKALRDRLIDFDEYQLAKYRMQKHAVKTIDVVNLVHPTETPAIKKLVNGTLKSTGSTWEAIISEKGSTTEAWKSAIPKMGHMALLRNLRNFIDKKVDPDLFLKRFVDGAKNGKQLPFRYYSAYNAVKDTDPRVLDAIEECLEISLCNLPTFNGRVISLCDNSGSAHGAFTSAHGTVTVSDIANLTGVITGKVADDGYIGIFGDRLEVSPIRKKTSVFDDHGKAQKVGSSIGENTEHGIWLFWDQAIKQKEHWDHVFIYSDMQAGHGGLYGIDSDAYSNYIFPRSGNYIDIPKLISEYRRTVNPNVFVYLVQVAGYQDVIIPEFFDRTFILGGWSGNILKFADRMAQQYQQIKKD